MDGVFYDFCEFVRTTGLGTFVTGSIVVGLAVAALVYKANKSNPATAIVPVVISLLLSLIALLCSL